MAAGQLIIFFTPSDINDFTRWHIAPFLGLWWVSTAMAIARLKGRRANLAVGVLVVASIIGYGVWSKFPGGGGYDPTIYTLDEHTAIGQSVLAQIGPTTPVVAQSRIGAHLVSREQIAMFPWFSQTWSPQMIVLDEKDTNPYPLTTERLQKFVKEYDAQPSYRIKLEQDGYIIFEPDAQIITPTATIRDFDGLLRLENTQVAQEDASKAFQPVSMPLQTLAPGRRVRVELYWVALAKMEANYTISVRLLAEDGRTIAQDDAWPARGLLSTMQWPQGQRMRDVHYLQLPPDALPAQVHVQVIVYNSDTQQHIEPQAGFDVSDVSP